MTAPIEIPVRLAADDTGVVTAIKELAAQLRAVVGPASAAGQALDQTAKAGERTGKAAEIATGGLSGLAKGLQALGGFLVARRLASFALQVVDTAESIGLLAEKTGLATETLSVLAFAGRTANVDIANLDVAFRGFSKSLVGLAQGSQESAKAFALIGLSLKDLQGLTVDQALAKTIDAFNQLPDGPRKAAAAIGVFGKAGSELIPLLNEIAGKGGLAAVTDEVRKTGLVFDRDAVAAAKRFKDQMALLHGTLQGAAFELARDLLPVLSNVAQGFRSFLAESPNLRRFAADITALATAFIALAAAFRAIQFLELGALVTNPFFLALVGVGALVAGIAALNQAASQGRRDYQQFLQGIGNTRALDEGTKALNRQREAVVAQIATLEEAERKQRAASQQQPLRETAQGQPIFPLVDPSVTQNLSKLRGRLREIDQQLGDINARKAELGKPVPGAFDQGLEEAVKGASATRDRFRDTELAAQQEELRLEEVQLKDSYDQRLITVEDFFAKRRDLTKQMAELEIASLQKELAHAEPGDQSAIEGRIAQRRIQLERELLELRIEQRRESEKAATEEEKTAKERLQAVLDQAQRVQNDVARQRERIQQLVLTGSITERQGEVAIAALEQSRLPVLTALADQADRMAASLGPAAIEQAKAFRAELETMAANANLAAREMAKLKSSLETNVEGGIADFLRDPTKPLDAIQAGLNAIISTLSDFFAKKIADLLFSRGDAVAQLATAGASLAPAGATLTAAGTTLVTAAPALTTSGAALSSSGAILLSSAAALSGAAAALAAAQAGGAVLDIAGLGSSLLASGFARGGAVPGFGLRDTVPAWLRPGEHVLTPEEVRAAGGHGAILAWRRALQGGLPPAPPVRTMGVRQFATGGPVFAGGGAGPGEFAFRGELGLADGLVLSHLETPAGQRALMKFVRANRKAIGQTIGRPR